MGYLWGIRLPHLFGGKSRFPSGGRVWLAKIVFRFCLPEGAAQGILRAVFYIISEFCQALIVAFLPVLRPIRAFNLKLWL